MPNHRQGQQRQQGQGRQGQSQRQDRGRQGHGHANRRTYWAQDNGLSFVNPYNFVRLSEEPVERAPFLSDEGTLTGVICCTLKTRTPLCVPDASDLTPSQRTGTVHKDGTDPSVGVKFYRIPLNGEAETIPAIPGSGLKGVIRNGFEALDNGCLSVNNSNIASSRSTFPKNPAILEGGWQTTPGGQRTWVLKLFDATMSDHLVRGAKERVWLKLIHKRGDKSFHWFTRSGRPLGVTAKQIESALADYQYILDQYRENDEWFAKELKQRPAGITVVPKVFPAFDESNPTKTWIWPIFYSLVKGILYLSPAQIGRTVFHNRVDDLLADHKHCTDPDCLCEPCRLFGMVGDDGQAATHIRFTDALMKKPNEASYASRMIPGTTIKELASPKPSSLEFYTKRPVSDEGEPALMWTYDTATFAYRSVGYDSQGRRKYGPDASLYAAHEPLEIRGRKFYLHHWTKETGDGADTAILHSCSTAEKTKRNMTAELVKSDTEFAFSVYFDRLTYEQLQKLVWALCIGENSLDGKQLYKIGHGKPLGLGSVKIRVDSVWTRIVDAGYAMRSESLTNMLGDTPFVEDDAFSDFLTITNFELAKGLSVSYPKGDDLMGGQNSTASHQWFIANRSVGEGIKNVMTPSIYRTLPSLPLDANGRRVLVLPGYKKNGDQRQSYTIRREDAQSQSRRNKGVIQSASYSPKSNSWHGFIKRDGQPKLFFHTSQSPRLDLKEMQLSSGMEVSFMIGENKDPKHKGQPCAIDLKLV